jgi:hypothetical protein
MKNSILKYARNFLINFTPKQMKVFGKFRRVFDGKFEILFARRFG